MSANNSSAVQPDVAGRRSGLQFITASDLYLLNEGTHSKLYDRFGAHRVRQDGVDGVVFAVWAPNAQEVSVELYGDSSRSVALRSLGMSGVWQGFSAGVPDGSLYKYQLLSQSGERLEKADPFAFLAEAPPCTASVCVAAGLRME